MQPFVVQGELAIPAQAVQRDIQGAFVLVVGEGERVITEGVNKVRPGAAVDAAAPGG